MLVLRVSEMTFQHREDFVEELGLYVGYLLLRKRMVHFRISLNVLFVLGFVKHRLVIVVGGFLRIFVKIKCLYRFCLC